MMGDEEPGGNVGEDAREAEGARDGAEREVLDSAAAADLREEDGERSDRERVDEDDEAEEANRPVRRRHHSRGRTAVSAMATVASTCRSVVAHEHTKR